MTPGIFDVTQEEISARRQFWRQETRDIFSGLEFKFIAASIEPTIDDDIKMIKHGWSLGGFKGMRHYVRRIKPRYRVKAVTRRISMAEYFWRGAQWREGEVEHLQAWKESCQ